MFQVLIVECIILIDSANLVLDRDALPSCCRCDGCVGDFVFFVPLQGHTTSLDASSIFLHQGNPAFCEKQGVLPCSSSVRKLQCSVTNIGWTAPQEGPSQSALHYLCIVWLRLQLKGVDACACVAFKRGHKPLELFAFSPVGPASKRVGKQKRVNQNRAHDHVAVFMVHDLRQEGFVKVQTA